MRIRRPCLAASCLIPLALSGCTSVKPTAATQGPTSQQPQNARSDDADPAAAAAKVASAERALTLGRAKLEKGRTDLANQETAGRESVTAAGADHVLAERALANFEIASKLRIEREKMGVQGMADGLSEAEEEMQQLELMYEKSELADKTKELVIRRGQRRIERSKRALALQEQALANLQAIDLAQERAKLQLDVDAKARALARATRDSAAMLADKKLAVQTQENELVKLEDELAASKRAAEKAAVAKGK